MVTKGKMGSVQKFKPAEKVASKLVAVPHIPFHPKKTGMKAATASPSSSNLPSSSPATGSSFDTTSVIKATGNTSNDIFTTSTITSPERVDYEYNVYAASFVPTSWRMINMEKPRTIIKNSTKHQIDYPGYVSTFAGTAFLPEQATTVQEGKQLSQSRGLSAQSYLQYFKTLRWMESSAKELENEKNSLYMVPLYHMQMSNGHTLWQMSVPGLREDNPFLEMGDTLQLRQLWVDPSGKLIEVPVQTDPSISGHAVYYNKGWTGALHESCIYSINRAQEIVYVKAEGLMHLHLGPNWVPMMVNVCFPLKSSLLEGQKAALHFIGSELRKTVQNELQVVSRVHNGELKASKGMKKTATGAMKEPEFIPHNEWIRKILFPRQDDGLMQTRLRKIPHRDFFDSVINYEQAHAIKSICVNNYGTLPFLVSGPPGTGKTKTLVETAMQLLNTTATAHILICAPSEAAADTLALRLKGRLNNKQLFRLIRPGRADNEVPSELTQYCYMENDMFYLPPFKTMMAYNMVVTSCQDAAILANARLTNNDLWNMEQSMAAALHPEDQAPTPSLHWGALLVDEAAQATEMDVLPAIQVVCPPSTYPSDLSQPLFVMAGDENQLGPRTASNNPQFSTSLFARLFDRPLYKDHPLSRSNIRPSTAPPVLKKSMLPIPYPPFANLVRNYRSHPSILSVPSSLFYNDTLLPEAPTPTTPLQTSSFWRGQKWPVLFLPHTGADEIEYDGGGWYNLSEARIACSIAQTLVYESNVQQSDICIMSPFAAQVKLLRSQMRSERYGNGNGLWDVNIGPLEAFQGLEKRVVIICTTRTRTRFLDEDAKRGLGIVHQKRKMNVALTRAKEALFVIGNPAVLRQDEHWRQWMAFCWRNGLVDDWQGVWKGGEEDFGNEVVGVLERALVVKGSQGKGGEGRALGAAATSLDMTSDYEIWLETLRDMMDEESNDEDETETDGDYDEENEDDSINDGANETHE